MNTLIECSDADINLSKLNKIFTSYITAHNVLGEDVNEVRISLTLAGEDEIKAINNQYREINEPTDILSFPMWENEAGNFEPPSDWRNLPLGDLVVCSDIVKKNAEENNKTFDQELILVLCHGFLHLIGFDHAEEEEKEIMWREQDALVAQFFALEENQEKEEK